MIKLPDLRIDNYITVYPESTAPQIEAVTRINGGDAAYIRTKTFKQLLSDHFEGVLITERWLFDFGFGTLDNKSFFKHSMNDIDVAVEFDARDNSFQLLVPDQIKTYPISYYSYGKTNKYVHQLQNLYHDLTGEELILNNGCDIN